MRPTIINLSDNAAEPGVSDLLFLLMTVSEEDYAYDDFDEPEFQKCTKNLEKLASRINLDEVYTADPMNNPKFDKNRGQRADKANRAVTEQVLDARTRMILLKMINNGLIYEINGCISTGKEANVYHARTETGEHRAIKIYKSTILTFKARDKYVSGEYRFRTGYSKHNPRKMVQVWAEKEMRNLKRLNQAGIPSPEPLLLKSPVLVMDFIGDRKGNAAPRLKDAQVPEEVIPEIYDQLLRIVRTLYQECHLVHADLSEYNLLYKDSRLVVIDVSQAVEREHSHALDFLRQDISNVLLFFRQHGLKTLSLQQFFDFVTDVNITDATTWLEAAHETASSEPVDSLNTDRVAEEAHHNAMTEESVFRNTFIPRSIEEVINVERLVANRGRGMADDVFTKLTGLVVNDAEEEGCRSDSSECEYASYSSDDDVSSHSDSPLDKEARRALRKENKKKVKEENKEKRKHKIKKHIKKKATKSKK